MSRRSASVQSRPSPILQQTNWPSRTTDTEGFRVAALRKEFKGTSTWKKQQLYLEELRAQKSKPWRRTYFPIVQRHDITPSSGPGTMFNETTRDMSKREMLEREERNNAALKATRDYERIEKKLMKETAASAPSLAVTQPLPSEEPDTAASTLSFQDALLTKRPGPPGSAPGHLGAAGGQGLGTLGPGGPPGMGGGAYYVLRRGNDDHSNTRYEDRYRFRRHVAVYGTQWGVI